MNRSENFVGARGQIVWILALVVSTATIIQLERLDTGVVPKAGSGGEGSLRHDPALMDAAKEALALADARQQAAQNDPMAKVSLLLALSVAVQAGALDLNEGRARADAIRAQAAVGSPAWQSVAVLAELTFGRQKAEE